MCGEEDLGVETRLSTFGTDGRSVVRLWGPTHDDMIMICVLSIKKKGPLKHSLFSMKG
jgi:hypothetical protein